MDGLKKWMQDTANILFDDSKNDLRSLPKTVRLQILLVLSFIWTTVFSLYVFHIQLLLLVGLEHIFSSHWFYICCVYDI